MPVNENTIQETTNYDQFVFIGNNREQARSHIEAIKSAFEEVGNLTRVQPILVNENMEIVDGQHRFTACKELGLPVFYSVRSGLGVADARAMNILHRNWTIDDFGRSYAEGGDRNYQRYLRLKEDYGFTNSILLAYILGDEGKGSFSDFRHGTFVVPTNQTDIRERLDKLTRIQEYTPYGRDKYFALAYLKAMAVPGFDEARLLRKMGRVGEQYLRRFGSIADYQRALEEVYNFSMGERNRLRLY